MDDNTSSWILEFILRQPIPDDLLHSIFFFLPFFPSPPPQSLPLRLKKFVLLRRLAADPISEPTLLSLELLHQFHLHESNPRLQSAYWNVAVGSTLGFLQCGDLAGFLDAVERTWRRRVGDAERSQEGKGLVSEELLQWRSKMEMATRSQEMKEKVLAEWDAGAGLRAVGEFLKGEIEEMGPTFLEIAARAQLEGRNVMEGFRERSRGDGGNGCAANEVGESSVGPDRVEQGELGPNSRRIDAARSAGIRLLLFSVSFR